MRLRSWPISAIVPGAIILIALFYAVSSWNNQFVFDDHTVIETLPPTFTLHDLGRIFTEPHYLNFLYFRPITRASLAIERAIFGLKPLAFRLFNAIEAGLVFGAVYLLLRSRQFIIHPIAAIFAGVWLVLHPAVSECVYPAASGRESLMPMLFIPLALWAYLREGRRWYALSMLLFVVALLCKEQSAVLPGLFVLAELLWRTGWRRRILRWIPVILVFGAYFFYRNWIFHDRTIHVDVWEHPVEPLVSLLYGLQTAITPFVALRYEPPMNVWFSWPRVIISACVILLLIFAVIKSGRAVILASIFWLAWFVLLQLPTAHIVAEQEAPFSERYVALALLAFPAIAAAIASQICRRTTIKFAVAIASVWVTAFGIISFARGGFYRNDFAFNSQWVRTNPQSSVAHSGMGVVYENQGDNDKAISEYFAALNCNSDDWTAHTNLGVILLKRGQYEDAARQLRIVVDADTNDPFVLETYGTALEMLSMQNGNAQLREAARSYFEEAIQIRPTDAQAHFQLGFWYSRFGDKAIARRELQTALSLDPTLSAAKQVLNELAGKN